MKTIKTKNFLLALLLIIVMITIGGCYTNTVDSLSTFKFQLPVYFYSQWNNMAVPDTNVDYVNLMDYPEYRDNRKKIKKAEIISFNYWIDSLMIDNNLPFDPNGDVNLEFDFIKFYLQFDGDSINYLIGEFADVNAKDFYRKPQHILEVPGIIAEVISVALKEKTGFFIKSQYSKTKGQIEEKRVIPMVHARFDMFLRFEINL